MNDNTVYIIESNSAGNGVNAILNAKKEGYLTHFVTNLPDKYQYMEPNPMEIAEKVTQIDTMDVIQMLHFFEDKKPAAIMTFDDFHILPVAVVSNTFGLIAPPIDGLINVRFKDKTREKTKGLGYPIKFVAIHTEELSTSSPIGYPCVVKPVDESGSVGVKLCLNDNDFIEASNKIKNFQSNITGYKYMKKLLVEEYIVGDEFSAEMCWDVEGNKWRIIGFTKKLLSKPPYFIEMGHIYPHFFSNDSLIVIEEILLKWLKAVNLTRSFAHIEFKLVNNQPVLIEINPRPAGGFINKLVEMVSKNDLIKHYMDLSLNKPLDLEKSEKSEKISSIKFVLPPKKGYLIDVEKTVISDEVEEFKINIKEKIIEDITNGDDRIGYVISIGPTVADVELINESFINSLIFKYRNESDENVKS
ncbi:ATP-grasp domain-containing protein [Sporosarcina sp. resist]|uniref:ATP-grasp domain-containing protein n=1 Tax=Sporosarcina sp. resist TaxID=2762563 RepID=UPI00164CFA31|nr:ATP-grasp domain-containing protein [Sporosarcina sp. resist]QNK89109.1 ATP-grasp domain-containing protein [Sporosarcina sp. resist]